MNIASASTSATASATTAHNASWLHADLQPETESASSKDSAATSPPPSPSDSDSDNLPGQTLKFLASQTEALKAAFGLDHDRRDTARDARADRRGRNDNTDAPNNGTPGVTAVQSPLGTPAPGIGPLPMPQPPEWKPMDQGAGKHGSESPSLRTRATEVAAEVAANAMSKEVPHASRNLLHFLGNSGKPLAQDVDQMMKDIPGFARTVEENQNNIGKDAIADAKAHGVTQPVTYPINTAWDRYKGVQNESRDWFLAVGDFSFNQTGQVTVYPPAQPGGEWRYEMNTQVNMRDQYNWDGQKSTQIGPLTVTDKELADMHRGGIAQEFLVFGASTPQATEGHGE